MPRSRISARHLSGSGFEIVAGAVGGTSRPRPRPARVAPRLGRPGGRPASALHRRNHPGRLLSGLPAGRVGKCKGCPGRAQPGFAARGKARNGVCVCPAHLEFRDSAGTREKDFLRAVIRSKDDSAALKL